MCVRGCWLPFLLSGFWPSSQEGLPLTPLRWECHWTLTLAYCPLASTCDTESEWSHTHKYTNTSYLCRRYHTSCWGAQNVTRPVLWILFHNSGKSPLTHSAFLITLREHGDGVCSRFPDHSPKVSHCARQGALGGDELVGTKVALENKKSGRWQKLKQ